VNFVTCIWGDKYSQDYVTALKAQVPELITLSDKDGSLIDHRSFRGWWSKMEVFRPENRHLRPCLFIDLDTIVIGSLAPFFELDLTKLWLIRDLFQPNKKSNSGLFIAPEDGLSDEIWTQAVKHRKYDNDQDGDFLSKFPHEKLQDHVTGILSYKSDQLYDSPKKARIVCFHGKPKPHKTEGWAKEHWESCLKT